MTTYGTPEGERTQDVAALTDRTLLDLHAVPAPAATGTAAVPEPVDEPAPAEPHMAYLVFKADGSLARLEFNRDRAEGICDDRRGVMVVVGIARDSRQLVLPEAEAARKALLATAALGEPLPTAA